MHALPDADAVTEAFQRKLNERGCELGTEGYSVQVTLDPGLPEGTYALSAMQESAELTAADPCAVMAGLGEFLLGWRFEGGIAVPERHIRFTPRSRFRGLYFATHFHNFYHTAPMEAVYQQIEDAAFRGGNAITVWYDMHHFTGIDDPASGPYLKRLQDILCYARKLGMRTCLTMLSNEGFAGTPDRLKASSAVQNGYHSVLDGHYGVEICPSRPGGIEEIIRQRRSVLRAFRGCSPDYVVYWPYDQGGCTCESCAPWGTNGFLILFPYFEEAVRKELPDTRIIMSTWYFDHFIDGEWERFFDLIGQDRFKNVHWLMDFFPEGKMPDCILSHGLPADREMIAFPEISMYGGKPWGGFGANPLPSFLQRSNDCGEKLYSGISCYSEGIFEDINKTIMLLYISGREKDARCAIRDYASWELMTNDADSLVRLAEILEETLPRETVLTAESVRFRIMKPDRVREAAGIAREIDATMPEPARSSWRWRILYLRALIDESILRNDGFVSEETDEYLRELENIYRIVPESLRVVSPPSLSTIQNKWLKYEAEWKSEQQNGD
ncbi:MAG: hypothetical protein II888_04045 [Clostridia bacterium]|nr:hypothetical protein [Clostridia bacterium]